MRYAALTVLAVLFCAGGVIGYQGYRCARDRREIQGLIAADPRFKSVEIHRLGYELVVEGTVSSKQDMELCFQKIDQIRSVPVVSRLVVVNK